MSEPDQFEAAVIDLAHALAAVIIAAQDQPRRRPQKRMDNEYVARRAMGDGDSAPPPAAPRTLTPDSLLTIGEAATELRISRSNLYKIMSRDEIRTLKLGNRTMIQYAEILRFIGELEDQPWPK
ncbi:helix-turn-helix domain-containing protein [Mycobacteroides abscessus]|uniref:helix-turn-helix domain-containing protein n=1 Tax=Mycobacteroides abscessus TaxID=36809 RepID=UPI00266FA0B8|nr:helix-turn-helix domain-containing protein [Mycobacteroides abscessus]MDO3110426.1 helix-turn-helix domain-containing protein [Mycobacteroides abscessus subsp. abscessus]